MGRVYRELLAMPMLPRCVLIGAVALGLVGGLVGRGVGLATYPPTAWFAVVEVGVPSALAGALLGLIAGGFWIAWRGLGRRTTGPRRGPGESPRSR